MAPPHRLRREEAVEGEVHLDRTQMRRWAEVGEVVRRDRAQSHRRTVRGPRDRTGHPLRECGNRSRHRCGYSGYTSLILPYVSQLAMNFFPI